MTYAIRFAHLEGSHTGPGPVPRPGSWLVTYDPDGNGGRGDSTWSPDPAKALRFATQAEAIACWQAQSKTRPLRPDGQPNRPLTALSVIIEPLK